MEYIWFLFVFFVGYVVFELYEYNNMSKILMNFKVKGKF